MDAGVVDAADLAGGIDLRATLESGQSYHWARSDGGMYDSGAGDGEDPWYHTVVPAALTPTNEPEVLRIKEAEDGLAWRASFDAEAVLCRLLRLDDDLVSIRSSLPDNPLVQRAFDMYSGLRLVRDPPFRSLVSFICSTQMRVGRIHGMQMRMARALGDTVVFDGERYYAHPRPEQLRAASEAELRELGLGYRAPYVQRTAEMVATGEANPAVAIDLPYEEAREYLTKFVGVGEKVADCVLLFSLGFLEAVPLDTWIQTVIAEYYPDCDRDSYEATSRAIRKRLGGPLAGYAQTYVFHWIRHHGPTE